MKQCTTIIFALFGCIMACKQSPDDAQDKIVTIPVTFVDGFGPFIHVFGGLTPEYTLDNPNGAVWVKTYKPIKGIPKQWKKVSKSMVWLDNRQLVYQNFHEGNIDKDFYLSLQRDWNWIPNEKHLSRKPIRCYVYVISGLDQAGKLAVMIDSNNNCDFNDEKPFYPETVTLSDTLRYYKSSYQVEYDIYKEGRVLKRYIPMVIKYRPTDPRPVKLLYSFPRYAVAKLNGGKDQKFLAVNLGFTSPAGYEVSELAVINDLKNEKIGILNGIRIGEYIDLGVNGDNKRYKNLGFNEFQGVLQLRGGEPLNNDQYSTQVGFKFKPFSALEFSSRAPLALQHYRGKYLYVEFWGTWCAPCLEELPKLVGIYEKADTSQVNFLGIVGLDSSEKLAKFLKKKPIMWSQILSNDKNKLTETYNIEMYPSSFLIGPDGVIVDKNLRGEKLEAKLKQLGCLK